MERHALVIDPVEELDHARLQNSVGLAHINGVDSPPLVEGIGLDVHVGASEELHDRVGEALGNKVDLR